MTGTVLSKQSSGGVIMPDANFMIPPIRYSTDDVSEGGTPARGDSVSFHVGHDSLGRITAKDISQ